jgi:hypothetical protein
MSEAARPDSNAPSSFDPLMKTVPTAPTRPRRRSGLASAEMVERTFMLYMSAKPLIARVTAPNATLIAPVNPLPVITTVVPPAVGPIVGEIPVITGGTAWYVHTSALTSTLVPPGVVTMMLCARAAWAGEQAVIVVSDTTLTLVAATAPNVTLVAPVNALPVIVTVVPPAGGPEGGGGDPLRCWRALGSSRSPPRRARTDARAYWW